MKYISVLSLVVALSQAAKLDMKPISLVELTAECMAESQGNWKENLADLYNDPTIINLSGDAAV